MSFYGAKLRIIFGKTIQNPLFCTPKIENDIDNMIEILKNEEQNRLNRLIDSAERVVVCVHVGPDGDAIGSALAMQSILRRRGKQVSVVAPNRFPDNLLWLPGAGDVRVYSPSDTSLKDLLHQAQLFLVLDLNEPSRMREMEEDVMSCSAPKVMLDHHLNPSPVWDMAVSRPEMCATGEVICHLAAQMGWTADMRQEEAVCLYTSMMCDTGAFTYNSNRAEVYDCISMLLRYGIDKDRIYRNVFWTATVGRMRLMGYMLYAKTEVFPHSHAAIITLTNAERRRFNTKNGDTEGFVNMPLQIQGIKLSIFLAEDTEQPGVVKVSLRSVDDFPCNEMSAEFFNGGGHKNASGGRLYCTMEEAVQVARKSIQAYLHLLKE